MVLCALFPALACLAMPPVTKGGRSLSDNSACGAVAAVSSPPEPLIARLGDREIAAITEVLAPPCQASSSVGKISGGSMQRGMILLEQKRYADARQEFLAATERAPGSAQAFFYLGMAE